MRHGASLVTKLVHFCYRVVHLEMVPFFLTHIHLFDQSEEEMSKHGQTHEQYQCYQRYTELLNRYLEAFSRREGFGTVEDCFEAVRRVVNTDSRTQAVLMSAITEQLQRVEAEIDRQRGMLTGAAQLQVDGRIIRSTDGVRGIYRREYIGGIHRLEEAAPAWIHTLAAADLSSRAQRIGRGAFPSRTFPSRTVVPQMQFFINAPPPLPLRRDRESERARTRARGTLLSQQQRSQRRTFRTNSIPRRSASSRGR